MKLSDVVIVVAVLGLAGALAVLLGDGWAGQAVPPLFGGALAVFVGLRIKERRQRRGGVRK
ncbi:hypothetical protein [Streptomyces sp. cmx-18-6]|uniref:hypothetical protein n=1 Tax=Streptomyces sp. cmx-18-6 TaxID=2790930 RepID=UPI00397ECCE0